MKWVLRIVLLLLAFFAASKAYYDSRQVLDSIETPGSNGQIYMTTCRPFQCDKLLDFYDGIESQYPALEGRASELRDEVANYQEITFVWGFASLLMLGGIVFLFVRKQKPRKEEPTPRPRNPLSIGS
ncbi:MAG: hypothetical protein WBP90_05940 [Terracidiphilus sp.]